MLDDGGIDELRAVPPPRRPARLDGEQLRALLRTLVQCPTAHRFQLSQIHTFVPLRMICITPSAVWLT